ncbi:nucleoside permease [Alkalimonas collagenimarina]|uniref:Nucleoside permease n=1 Tax=Alkalimonas collagenimarina TaxID=400390 RepID=A0ABT9H030_9GAMM|nr:nucleoside permease [Alkalimonas collagenimarina]MDP4536676.1 nucleoside permease [Alkalimonas collagenimarina]
MKATTRIQLSSMMFLEFFIWGAWFVTLGTFLAQHFSASGSQMGLAFETQSIGAIIAPFIIGLIADRYFSAQKILGFMHLTGAALLFFVATTNSFAAFYPLVLIYMLLYMPTLALVNTIAFKQLKDNPEKFAQIRVFGTVGWIIAGVLIGYFGWESSRQLQNTFLLASFASALLGVLSFFLPNTPPSAKQDGAGLRHMIGLDALGMLRDKTYLVFFITSVLICIPLAFYYQNTNLFLNDIGMAGAAATMSLGQVSEILFMLMLPLFLKRFGIKITLLIGILAWVIRYVLFAYGDTGDQIWMLFVGILLHGICYDFFFVTGQIYTEKKAGLKNKAAAQGLITLATYGVGMLIGFRLAGWITDTYTSAGSYQWEQIWLIPAGFAVVVLLLFIVLFREKQATASE